MAVAVHFLVQRPRFHGSGYLFEKVAGAVAVGPDAGVLADDIRDVVRESARRALERETRYVARLAARYWTDSLAEDLAAIPGPTATFLVVRALEVRSSYRAIGLVSG